MKLYTKIQILVISNAKNIDIVILVVFYFIFSEPGTFVTWCAENPTPCMDAFEKSLKDIQTQKNEQSFLEKAIHKYSMGDKTIKIGTGTVETNGRVYVAKTIEYSDSKTNEVIRQVSDCISSKKKD
jgi:hypothetical protein